MADIRINPAVIELLGPERVQKVRDGRLASNRCPICLDPVPADGPANVVVKVTEQQSASVALAHPKCAPSSVMAPAAVAAAMLPAEGAMVMTAKVLTRRGVRLPILVAELATTSEIYQQVGPPGEMTNMLVSTLLSIGMDLVTRLDHAPESLLPWPAQLVAVPDGLSQLHIERPADGPFYAGTVALPTGWRARADRLGWCVLYCGTGLSHRGSGEVTEARLRAAAAAGTLTGARLTITWPARP